VNLTQKYSIIVPTFQSAASLVPLIHRIRDVVPLIPIIVIDDGSTDNTLKILHQVSNVTIVHHPRNMGKGAAIKSGILKAKEMNCTCGIFLDSDLQHPPERIPAFIRDFEKGDIQLVLGKRSFSPRYMPYHRILSNTITSFIISLRTMKRVHDTQCGFRLVDLEQVQVSQCADDGFQFESELLIRALVTDKGYSEVKIPTIYNQSRSSINNFWDTIRFIRLVLKSYLWT